MEAEQREQWLSLGGQNYYGGCLRCVYFWLFSSKSMYFICNQKKESKKQTEKEKGLGIFGGWGSSPCSFGCVFIEHGF